MQEIFVSVALVIMWRYREYIPCSFGHLCQSNEYECNSPIDQVMVSWVVMLCSVVVRSMLPPSATWSGQDVRKWHRYRPRLERDGRCC